MNIFEHTESERFSERIPPSVMINNLFPLILSTKDEWIQFDRRSLTFIRILVVFSSIFVLFKRSHQLLNTKDTTDKHRCH